MFVPCLDSPAFKALHTKRPNLTTVVSAAKDGVCCLGNNRRKSAGNIVMRQRCQLLIREGKCGKYDVIVPVVQSRDVTVDLAKFTALYAANDI